VEAAHQDDGQVRNRLPDLFDAGAPGRLGHVLVQDDELHVLLVLAEDLHGFLSVLCEEDREAR